MKKLIMTLILGLVLATTASAHRLEKSQWPLLKETTAQADSHFDAAQWDSLQRAHNPRQSLSRAIRVYGREHYCGRELQAYERTTLKAYFWARREQIGKEAGRCY